MKTLLHIDSSPRLNRSLSRRFTNQFRSRWMTIFPDFNLKYRDLYITPPPHVDLSWIDAAFTSEQERTIQQHQALEISNHFVDEFVSADVYLLGVPMYNFGMPSILKAYVDNIVRINRTFLFNPDNETDPYTPLVHNKKMFVVIATGDHGYQDGGALSHMNHLEPHIRTAFGFVGIKNITFIYCGNDEFGGTKLEKSIQQAIEEIDTIIDSQKELSQTAG